VDLYHQLALFVNSLKTLQETYASGNIAAVASIFTQDVYAEMTAQLEALALDLNISKDRAYITVETMYEDYEKIRLTTAAGLNSLHAAILQYATLEDITTKYLNAKEKADILLDPVKLKAYIEEYNRRSRVQLFPDSNVKAVKAQVKPEYAEYIKLYGYPQGGAFDPEKLGAIMNDLKIANNTANRTAGGMGEFIKRSQNFKSQK
jgi:hypothetical protein